MDNIKDELKDIAIHLAKIDSKLDGIKEHQIKQTILVDKHEKHINQAIGWLFAASTITSTVVYLIANFIKN